MAAGSFSLPHGLNQIQNSFAKLAIFRGKTRVYRSIPLKDKDYAMTLSQLSAGLLFLHGHITDPALAATLAAAGERVPSPISRSPVMDLFKSLMYLGGRPMHAGHNYDLDEPFEPSFGNRVATERLFGRTLPHDEPRRAPLAQATDACLQGCG